MSVVIAKKYNGGVIIGADKRATCGNHTGDVHRKVWKSQLSASAWGCVGFLRDCNIIGVMDEVIDTKDILLGTDIDFKYVVKTVVRNLFKNFEAFGRVKTADGTPQLLSEFLFVTCERIFKIGHDGSVTECEDFATIGCGDQYSEGFLMGSKGKKEKEVIEEVKKAVEIACQNDPYVGGGVDIIILKR